MPLVSECLKNAFNTQTVMIITSMRKISGQSPGGQKMAVVGKEWLRVNSGEVSWPLCTFSRSILSVMHISDEEVDRTKTLK